MKKVLFVGAHSDDIEIGAGGTVARFIDEGNDVKILFFSVNKNLWPKQKNEYKDAARILKVPNIEHYDLESCWKEFQEKRQYIYDILEENRNKFCPDIVFTHSSFDTNQDHQTIYNETVRVFKKSSSIYGYEFPNNNLKFDYDFFVKLEEKHINRKIMALKCYKSQQSSKLKNHNYLDEKFIKSLAIVRGQQVMSEYAECFEVIRIII